ncbi:MAG TPA: hypothetical protein VKA07_00320 [Candidatus Sulfotelmatobacter sp.]|nr:hypothetical protein [Candidatus Sulfotelmatobacter sp.]HLM82280.1 hypothetical protein [Terriglobales bacterium]
MSSVVWEDLILAILSVNRYSLEKAYSAVDGFRSEELFDLKKLAEQTVEEITVRLRRGGYDREEYLTKLFALRLMSLAAFVKRIGVEESERILTSPDKRKIEEFLQPVKGIGPQVLNNFFTLRQGAHQP